MLMRETERSLKAYFIIIGGAYAAYGIMTLLQLSAAGRGVHPAGWLIPVAYLPLGIAFVVAGLRLKQALLADPRWILMVVIASGALVVVEAALVFMVRARGADTARGVGSLVGFGVRVAIALYLHRSVKRLSDEAKARLPSVFA
jgi:hypothetical protein